MLSSNIISAIIFIAVTGIVIWFASRLMRFKIHDLKTSYLTAASAGVISFLISLLPAFLEVFQKTIFTAIFLIANEIILLILIKKFFRLNLKSAVLGWFLVFMITTVIGLILGLLFNLNYILVP